MFVYCCDLDEDQIKFMQKSRYYQRVHILFLATVYILYPLCDLVSLLQLLNGLEWVESVESCVPRNMTHRTSLINAHLLNLEASRTNVSEETLFN